MFDGNLILETPDVFRPLDAPGKRYLGAYGGRGSGKSHHFAERAVVRCAMAKTRIVCIREVQNTIRDSVRQLIVAKIEKFGLQHLFEVLDYEIRGKNGSLIIFRGMQSYNAENIKSLEDFDVAWVEEAQAISERSWTLLRPTIRNENSQIWCSWNPRNAYDPVDKFFRGPIRHPSVACIEVNWYDNPHFTKVLWDEMCADFLADPDKAEHVWNGAYEQVIEGAYYARLMLGAQRNKRIGSIEPLVDVPVHTSWDLGIGDATSIWWWQVTLDGIRVVDFYENSGLSLTHYAAIVLGKPYMKGNDYVPHDARQRSPETGRTRVQAMMQMGLKPIVVTNQKIEDGIEAVRQTIPMCYFNADRCAYGLECLRNYRVDYDPDRRVFANRPLHDWSSHAADAFRYMALAWRMDHATVKKPEEKPKPRGIREMTMDEVWKLHKPSRHGRIS